MRDYIKQHIESGVYGNSANPGAYIFNNIKGWSDYLINDNLVFSHRINTYTAETFEEGLHSHDYYEIVIYITGDVEYIRENEVSAPTPGMVISCAPDVMHTARLLADGIYERYVIYLDRQFFTYCGEQLPLPVFIGDEKDHGSLQPDEEMFGKLRSILSSAEEAARKNTAYGRALAHSYIFQFFALLDGSVSISRNTRLPENVARIKKYIDTYYGSIEGVSEIASYFFYSREHASRLFRQYFNITLSDYLMQRRVAESTKLLLDGSSVADACYSVGFHSVSSYINAFRRITGCLPSEYKKKKQ
jgi:AraC-like DNA-binding protein